MPTSVDVEIAVLFAHLDDNYELGPFRCSEQSNYKDCSGYAGMGMNAGRRFLHLDEWPCYRCDTFQFEAFLNAHPELRLSAAQGRATRGSWCGWNRNGEGHMATSLGDGRTIEARSHALDVGIFGFDERPWEWYMKPPGLTGFGLPGQPNPGPTTTKEAEDMGMTAKRVPGSHVQSKAPWLNRYPMVAAILQPNDHTTIAGFNGAVVKNWKTGADGTPYEGMHVLDLGVLHSPIGDIDIVADDPQVNLPAGHYRMVGLAGDGGTFVIEVSAYYL